MFNIKIWCKLLGCCVEGLKRPNDETCARLETNNLLLDDKLNPKIADFGLARFITEDRSHISTRVEGTLVYMAPEYALHGQLTDESMNCYVEEATRVAHIGLLCTQASPALRPPVSRVVQMLRSDKGDLPVVTMLTFIDLENLTFGFKTFSTSADSFSTILQAR
eukprot:Gb_13678 [translate_table: standard]